MRKRGSPLESNSSTEEPRVRVARLGRPHGLDGFLGLYVEPEDLVHFEAGARVEVGDRSLTVRATRRADKGHQVAFAEITNRDGAEQVRGCEVHVTSRRRLAEDEYWPDDLVGLEVRPMGGVVAAVIHGQSQSRLRIDREGVSFEIPFVRELVPVVDLESGYVEIADIQGLIPPSPR